jgi:hypothetical protein
MASDGAQYNSISVMGSDVSVTEHSELRWATVGKKPRAYQR